MPRKSEKPALLADELRAILNALSPGWSEQLQRLGKTGSFARVYSALSRIDADTEARSFDRRK